MPVNRTSVNNITGDLRVSTEKFLRALEDWSMSPAVQYMWLVNFSCGNKTRSFPLALINANENDYNIHSYENRSPSVGGGGNAVSKREWNLATDNEYFNDSSTVNDNDMGCMVIHGVNIPGEQVGFGYSGAKNRGGLIPVAHQTERLEPQELTMQVYEGNLSFVDTVIRPWIILTGHLGQVTRNIDDPANIKCNITITQFAKTIGRDITDKVSGRAAMGIPGVVTEATGDTQPSTLIIRKQFTFYNACPVRMESSDLTYGGDQGVMLRNITWMYSHYSISNLQKNGVTTGDVNKVLREHFEQKNSPTHVGKYAEKHNQLIETRWEQIAGDVVSAREGREGTNHKVNMLERHIELQDKFTTQKARHKQITENGTDPRTGDWTENRKASNMRLTERYYKWTNAFLKHRENAGFTSKNGVVTYGKRSIKLYGPKHPNIHPKGYPQGANFETRWRDVNVTNLCGGVNGRPDVCKPAPPPPGSALDRIRSSLRNLGKLARNARGFAAAFKRVGKAKGIKGKISALGDLNKSFGTLTGRAGKPGGKHKTLGGGMPKAGGYSKTGGAISGVGAVVDEAKKAARAVTGAPRAKGAQ